MIDALTLFIGFGLGVTVFWVGCRDYLERRGAEKYIDQQIAEAKWWKEHPDGIEHHPDGTVTARYRFNVVVEAP